MKRTSIFAVLAALAAFPIIMPSASGQVVPTGPPPGFEIQVEIVSPLDGAMVQGLVQVEVHINVPETGIDSIRRWQLEVNDEFWCSAAYEQPAPAGAPRVTEVVLAFRLDTMVERSPFSPEEDCDAEGNPVLPMLGERTDGGRRPFTIGVSALTWGLLPDHLGGAFDSHEVAFTAENPVIAECPQEEMTAPGVTKDAVYVAANTVESGLAREFLGDAGTAMAAAIDRVNAHGGAHGRRVVLRTRDDSWDRATGLRYIENAAAGGCTFALLVNPSTEGLDEAIRNGTIDATGMPVIGSFGSLSSDYQSPWVFPVGPSTTSAVHVAVKHAADMGAQTFGLVYDRDYPFGSDGPAAFSAAVARVGGTEKVSLGIQGGGLSYRNEANHFADACGPQRCDVVLWLMDVNTAMMWVDSGAPSGRIETSAAPPLLLDRFAVNCPITGSNPCDVTVWTGVNPPVGALAGDPDVARYAADVSAADPTVDLENSFTELAYVGTEVFLSTLKDAGRHLTREGIRATLDSTTFVSGFSTPLQWRPGNHRANQSLRGFKVVSNVLGDTNWAPVSDWVVDPWPEGP